MSSTSNPPGVTPVNNWIWNRFSEAGRELNELQGTITSVHVLKVAVMATVALLAHASSAQTVTPRGLSMVRFTQNRTFPVGVNVIDVSLRNESAPQPDVTLARIPRPFRPAADDAVS